MSRTLLFSLVSGFASGIACRSFVFFSWSALIFVLILAILFATAWLMRARVAYLACALLLCGFALGAGRVLLAPSGLPASFTSIVGETVSLEGVVIHEPDIRETTQRVTVSVQQDGEETKVLAVAPQYPEVLYGERVRVTGILTLPEPFVTDAGRTFRYDQFLQKDGVSALVERARIEPVAPPEGVWSLGMGTLLSLKHTFQAGLANALPEPNASLASGLITGGKQGLGERLLDAFIVAGLVHIVVLSGYNVMIVAEGVLRAFGFLSKRGAAVAAGVTIALFVLIAGAGAASIRAGIMAGLALIARATGRTYAVIRALVVAAVVMLIMNPYLLAFDPGFQLSFLATLGLIVGAPIAAAHLGVVRSSFWRELLAATIAAQVSVLPLLLYQSGLFSIVSLPANLLVLPLVPLAMAASAFAGVAGIFLPAVAPILGLPAHAFLSYIIWVAEFLSTVPGASFTVPRFSFAVVVLAYVVLALAVLKNRRMQAHPSVSGRGV